MQELKGKVAVVTGAASGIGRGLARELGAAGCLLSLADIDEAGLDDAAKSLAAEGYEVSTTRADVGQLEDVERFADDTLRRFGAAHVVVNNAGVIAWNPIDSLTIGDWHWVVDVNIYGVVHGVHVFLPILERQGVEGHFVNIASVGGILADTPFMATYSTTKAAVIGLSLTLASEMRLQKRPIGVTIVCPGATQDSYAHDADRNRPASVASSQRTAEAQALRDMVGKLAAEGQPLSTLTRRVVDAVLNDQLWVFPNPDAEPLLRPKVDGLREALRQSSGQPMSD